MSREKAVIQQISSYVNRDEEQQHRYTLQCCDEEFIWFETYLRSMIVRCFSLE